VNHERTMQTVVAEEEKVLARVLRTLDNRASSRPPSGAADYDAQLISLRDQIQEARLEDVPPLVEEMERLSQISARRAEVREGSADAESPYFGRLVLEEGAQKREVLIGKGTYLDPRTGLRIVDWRDAPVSRLYYRYDEGDDYDEEFGGRHVEGEVLVRRSLAIVQRNLHRIGTPQGTFVKRRDGTWHEASGGAVLQGGQGSAMTPEAHHKPRVSGRPRNSTRADRSDPSERWGKSGGSGQFGVGATSDAREDKHLPEITALIDPRQFDLITRPDAGVVVIQGGAGSGKTTIGLHRMAYLAFQNPERFRPETMLVVVFNQALARYVSRVLPALGIRGTTVTTYDQWVHGLRIGNVRGLPATTTDETPSTVIRFKNHPAMLQLVDAFAARTAEKLQSRLHATLSELPDHERDVLLRAWNESAGLAFKTRIERLASQATALSVGTRHGVERFTEKSMREVTSIADAWAEMLTDRALVREAYTRDGACDFSESELSSIHAWCTARCSAVLSYIEDQHAVLGEKEIAERDDDEGVMGVDGRAEYEKPALDKEDESLLLLLKTKWHGPIHKGRTELRYQHVLVDEAQDLSPVNLQVVMQTVHASKSVTLAGDVAQRLYLENGFTDWSSVLGSLGLEHVQIEPLRIGYRSTKPIIEFAEEVLGPLRHQDAPAPSRMGVPVEVFEFAHTGDAVGFISEALRELVRAEPRASVAVVSRYPEQADNYYRGLLNAEVPNVRRIAEQDFPFRPGVDVTDVRQVKGLEFDYVILVEVSAQSYPSDDESRHLLHIAATRAAHQLWVVTTGRVSGLVPPEFLG
jgi:DNA helicase-2/ATP-dependent DNA helicase PcrA